MLSGPAWHAAPGYIDGMGLGQAGASAKQALTRAAHTLAATRHPDGYHGDYQGDAGFFEGWYVKLVSADRSARLAIIPGIFRGGAGGHDEAFVQVLDGMTGESWYETEPASAFWANSRRFDVTVGASRFGEDGIEVDLPGAGLRGAVRFTTALDPWPVTWRSPGIMGPYGWVPVMECYHGLVSFGHDLAGTLTLGGRELNFDGGRGYLEKDWGRAFPQGYVWMQSNHFSHPGVSLSASIATIPWGRTSFRGFIVGVRRPHPDGGQVLHRFATYTGARTTALEMDDAHVAWEMCARSGAVLRLQAERRRGGLLHAPVRTQMHRRVEETLDARIHLELIAPDGRVVLDDVGEAAGLEVHGDLEALLAMSGRR
ncbi:tocopherol cyclase family protein [Demequina sp.]|uniref:tocopherol cyclase family protein n=1 Tax=Demequina sp. TaxID=2050685 RepID=UPI003A8461AF